MSNIQWSVLYLRGHGTWLRDLAARAIPAYIFFHLPFSLYFDVFLLVLGFLLLSIVSRFC